MYRDKGIWTRKREIETRAGRETSRQVQGQRDTEKDTNRDRDRGTGKVTGNKDKGTGT